MMYRVAATIIGSKLKCPLENPGQNLEALECAAAESAIALRSGAKVIKGPTAPPSFSAQQMRESWLPYWARPLPKDDVAANWLELARDAGMLAADKKEVKRLHQHPRPRGSPGCAKRIVRETPVVKEALASSPHRCCWG